MQRISKSIIRQRALIKKFQEAGSHHLQASEAKLTRLLQEMERSARRLETFAADFESISWKCIGAFVVFNHKESFRRCIRDYSRASKWLQPKPLRFKGIHPLTVVKAPNPSDIKWENMEVTRRQRFLRVALTVLVSACVIFVSFTITAAAHKTRQLYSNSLPADATCLEALPSTRNITSIGATLAHYDSKELEALGIGQCEDDELYIAVIGVDEEGNEAALPEPGVSACLDPCVEPTSTEDRSCAGDVSFTDADIATCYCRQLLIGALTEGGGAGNLKGTLDGACDDLIEEYIKGQRLLVIASIVVAVVNVLLQVLFRLLVPVERHASITAEAMSVSFKVALGIFVNTALVLFLADMTLGWSSIGIPQLSRLDSVTGTFFDQQWYTTTGAAIVTTMLANMVSPHIAPILHYWVITPLKRRCSNIAVTQQELNEQWIGPSFDLSTRVPFVLNTLGITIIFCPALPLVLPIALLFFVWTYFMDKWMILYFYRKPPQYDIKLIKRVTRLMPYMALIHCLFAIWTFAEGSIFQSSTVYDASYFGWVAALDSATGVIQRGSRTICFPFLCLAVVLLAGEAMQSKLPSRF
ncbi:unnamed protein product [Chrysoparadoxa australica]